VLLGRSALVSADLAAGRLVRLFDLALASRWRYYVVYLVGAVQQRKVKSFRDWLFYEMEQDRKSARRPLTSKPRVRRAPRKLKS